MRIRSDDVELNVVERGRGEAPPLVLVHGFPLDHRMWVHQLEELADGRRVVAYDVRGMGGSDLGDGQHTMELFVDDLVRVLDARELGPAVVCGLSMGGYVVLRALEREPDRIRAAVLADTRSAADDDDGRLKRAASIRAIKEGGSVAFAESFVGNLVGARTLGTRPEVVEAVKEMIRENDPRGLAGAQFAMLSRTDTTSALEHVSVPVLVVVGEEDTLTPPAVAREMAERIPDARLATVPEAGHVSPLENPDAFNAVLREFLDELD